MSVNSQNLSQDFIKFCINKHVLKFGEFTTKAGRISPYFFNAGLFDDGESLLKLGEFYANSIEKSGLQFDMLFGPAYKGIPLVASIAIAYAKNGRNLPYAYNRKEAKAMVDEVLAANAPMVAEFKAGKDKAFNALVGQTMKASKGKANPAQVSEMLREKLKN